MLNAELLLNAIAAGLLLGGFYAALSLGMTIVFGQLDIVNIAHPAFIIVGSITFIIKKIQRISKMLQQSNRT